MRKGVFGKTLITDDNNEIIGINLGSNFCAEHEFGIQPIQKVLGVPTEITAENYGIKARQITKFNPQNFIYKETTRYNYLVFRVWAFDEDNRKLPNFSDLAPNPQEIETGWSSNDFVIIAPKQYRKFLRNLWSSFQKKDIAIGLGNLTNPFINSGLVILIVSKVPPEMVAAIEKDDKEYIRRL